MRSSLQLFAFHSYRPGEGLAKTGIKALLSPLYAAKGIIDHLNRSQENDARKNRDQDKEEPTKADHVQQPAMQNVAHHRVGKQNRRHSV